APGGGRGGACRGPRTGDSPAAVSPPPSVPTIRRVRAVVTGGAGFIGSNLVDALVGRGDDVVVVDDLSTGTRDYVNPGASFVEADIREGIDAGGADVVFHLAAQADVQTSVRRPDRDAAVNVVGTVGV